MLASVTANRPDAVIVTPMDGPDAGNPIVIILQAVAQAESSGFLFDNGVNLINSMTAGGAYYVPAGENCAATLENGAQGILGDVYDLSGQSITEALIEVGSLVPSSGDACNGDALVGCYGSIEVNEPVSPFTFSRFIWKPVSERDGSLVVLIDPSGATPIVRGAITETLVDFGPSNGFGTTARGSKSGCSYGNNITVEFFDFAGRRIRRSNGDESVTVPAGCDRFEF